MSDMSNLYRAYSAVHNSEVSNQLNESRDLISGMQFTQMNSSDLQEVAEEILESMFDMGLDMDQTADIIADILSESLKSSQSDLRAQKVETLGEAFDSALENGHTVERFLQYRQSKKVQENFHNISNEDQGNKKLHEALIAQNRKEIKEGILSLVEKKVKDSSYLETNMKKRQENNEKARKDMEKMGTSMKNPHFEEVSQIRKDWASSYKSIYEKMDPVGQEDGDIDNDGDKDSSDEYLMKRRKAIGKAMGKKGKCENCGGKGCEKCKDMKEGVASAIGGAIGDVLHGVGKVAGGAARGVGAAAGGAVKGTKKVVKSVQEPTEEYDNTKPDPEETAKKKARLEKKRGMKLDDHPQYKKESVQFSEKELKAFEEITKAWVD